MATNYTINGKPLERWGLRAGTINERLNGYALGGAWSLPGRLGKTFHNWQGAVELYVDADDIRLDGRDLTLKVCCLAKSPADLQAKLSAFEDDLPEHFTLAHPVLGNYDVGLQSVNTTTYGNTWGAAVLKLRESNPTVGTALPEADHAGAGIDGYSWEQLGFVVKAIDGRYNLPAWQPLNVTASPLSDNWLAGYRDLKTVTVSGTLKGRDYVEFARRVAVLQAVIGAPGLRTVSSHGSEQFTAFAVEGFSVAELYNFKPTHWGRVTCKLIVI